MDCYGASIISDMQPRASSQGRIRYTPMKVFTPMVFPERTARKATVLSKSKRIYPIERCEMQARIGARYFND